MKRLAIFLAAVLLLTGCITIVRPVHGAALYTVWHSTGGYPEWSVESGPGKFKVFEVICYSQTGCEDMAFALNEAHKRRMPSVKELDWRYYTPPQLQVNDSGVIYPVRALPVCGADDCGKQP